ncbi:unnamed protein product [Linum tenue]|uniref:Uncharacterized protein n=1 Tax=Linum tenue TaxID=586396 RepID=A0AAV0R598_9ROSI|nr:unnamed protein product [Linum tenue]
MVLSAMPRSCSTKCLAETSSLGTPSYPPTLNVATWPEGELSLTPRRSEIPSPTTPSCLVTFDLVGLRVSQWTCLLICGVALMRLESTRLLSPL